ncbi:MAG TPA: hypothetical protein VGK64_13735 [Bryobacteraceae bacterium]
MGGALDIAPVLRVLLIKPEGANARRQTKKELIDFLGGALDIAPVLRVLLIKPRPGGFPVLL